MKKVEILKLFKRIEKKAAAIVNSLENDTTKRGETYKALAYIREQASKLDGIVWRNE